ncbi:DMT family transporter [Micropruina sp.]|uniref:DMT family transporter n=1 Tax=Micropruina sp. TaxID=2737536 RepID=UPI0039E2DD05
MSRSRLVPDAVLLVVAVVWGGSYLAAKDLAEATSAVAVMCLRFLPAALILLAIAAVRGRLRAVRTVTGPGLLLGTLRAATIALETIGVTLTSATNAGLIIGLSVLITPILESTATRRRLSGQLTAAVLLGFTGVALLVGGEGLSAPNIGDLLIFAAALTRALLGVAGARLTAGGAAVLPLTTIELTCGAIAFTLWGGGPALGSLPHLTGHDWAVLAYLSVGCTLLAFLGQLWATKHTSASRAGILLGTEPAWALSIGIGIAGDTIGPIGLAGGLVLLAAVTWGAAPSTTGARTPFRRRPPDPAAVAPSTPAWTARTPSQHQQPRAAALADSAGSG